MARSVPVSIQIPAIGVKAPVIRVGLVAGGVMAVPPLAHPFLTGWFDHGPDSRSARQRRDRRAR